MRSWPLALLALLASATSCRDAAAPPGPPYLAVVADLNALPGVAPLARITYHVRELSGTLGIDRRIPAAPTDTLVLPLPPATYVIDVEGVPGTCHIRDGAQRAIVLTDADNTGLVRYDIQCRGALNVEVGTDGYDADSSFVYRIRPEAGDDIVGRVGANDTLVVPALAAGRYEVRLASVAPNCVVTSDGGPAQLATVDSTGGTTLRFRVQCSREADRPRLLDFRSGYVLGSSTFVLRVYDPNRDVDGFTWDLTDCAGSSVLPDRRERTRRGLLAGRTRLQDTLVVVGAYDVGIPDAEMRGRCTQVRVFDYATNGTELREHRIGEGVGTPPRVTAFGARLLGTTAVQTTIAADDPDGDFVGVFVAVKLRDGTLGAPDGLVDVGIMDPAGYLGTSIPPLSTSGRIAWDDVYAIIVWAIDAAGNAVRLEDGNMMQ